MQYRVYNKHSHGLTHTEMFKGDMITIPAGEYILMDYDDAVQFKSQHFPIKKDAMGQQTPESYKMIQIEAHISKNVKSRETTKSKEFICPMDGKKFTSKVALDAYIEQNFKDVPRVEEPEIDQQLMSEG